MLLRDPCVEPSAQSWWAVRPTLIACECAFLTTRLRQAPNSQVWPGTTYRQAEGTSPTANPSAGSGRVSTSALDSGQAIVFEKATPLRRRDWATVGPCLWSRTGCRQFRMRGPYASEDRKSKSSTDEILLSASDSELCGEVHHTTPARRTHDHVRCAASEVASTRSACTVGHALADGRSEVAQRKLCDRSPMWVVSVLAGRRSESRELCERERRDCHARRHARTSATKDGRVHRNCESGGGPA